jgi:hypothetical protein
MTQIGSDKEEGAGETVGGAGLVSVVVVIGVAAGLVSVVVAIVGEPAPAADIGVSW